MTTRFLVIRFWLLATWVLFAATPGEALATDAAPESVRTLESLVGVANPETPAASTPPASPAGSSALDTLLGKPPSATEKPAPKFGTPGTTHVVFVPLIGKAIGDLEWFYILNLEVDHFIFQNTCVNVHLQGIYYDQPGPPTVGYGPAVTLRRYFHVHPTGNFFIAGGVGLTYSDNPVPEIVGSKLNFTPRAAIGFTQQMFGNTRLVGGIRVIHSQGLGQSTYARTIFQPFMALSITLY